MQTGALNDAIIKTVNHCGESIWALNYAMISADKWSAELIFKFLALFSSDFFLALSEGLVIATMKIVRPLQTRVLLQSK